MLVLVAASLQVSTVESNGPVMHSAVVAADQLLLPRA